MPRTHVPAHTRAYAYACGQTTHAHRSKVVVKKATGDVYAAVIDDKVAIKMGSGDWSPNSPATKASGKDMKLASSGFQFAVWEVQA